MNPTTDLLRATSNGGVLELAILCEMVSAESGMRLQTQLERAVTSRPPNITKVRLEVSRVLAMSSVGFEALLRLHRSCRDAKLTLTMTRPSPEFMGLLARMGFDRLFRIESHAAV